MARYIDAVELIKAIEENQRNTEHHKDGRGKQIHVSEHRHFINMVYEQPTADVAQKSEVAKEIIGEILLNHTPDIDGFFTIHESELAKIKKKYTEESRNGR